MHHWFAWYTEGSRPFIIASKGATVALTPVFDRYARGYPEHMFCATDRATCTCTRPRTERDDVTYAPVEEVFTERFNWDAHFAAWTTDGNAIDNTGVRLTHKAIGIIPNIRMVLFVVDVEPEGHAPRTPEWDAQEQPKIEAAIAGGAYFYSTRGGYRLVWRLVSPFPINSAHDAARWAASYKNALDEVEQRFQIKSDRRVSDWTRMYRLPFVTRDGVAQTDVETTDINAMGLWSMKFIEAPAPKTLEAVDDDATPASEALLAHVRERLKMHGPAISGKGGDAHTFQACAMVVRGYALPDSQAVQVLDEWNQTCEPPWDGDELRTKMDNAFNYGSGGIGEARAEWEGNERIRNAFGVKLGAPRNAPMQPVQAKVGGVLGALASLEVHWDQILAGNIAVAACAINDPHKALYAQALAEVAAYNGTDETDNAFRPYFISAEEMFATPDKAPEWLVEKLIIKGGTAAIGAEPKAAKTWAGTEIALALATGTPVFGKYAVKATSVAYFYTEDMHDAIKSRVRGLLAGRQLTPKDIAKTFYAQPRGRRIDVTKAEHCAGIIASVRGHEMKHGKIGLVVLDPLRNIHLHDEDKSGEMVVVFEALKMIGTLLGCTIIIVHHSKKANGNGSKRGGQKLRGSGAIHGFLDSALYFSETEVGDDGDVFKNMVESETKTGRSAGMFELTLKIKDDPVTHTCVHAAWELGRKGETMASEDTVTTWRETALDICEAYLKAKVKGELLNTKRLATEVKCRAETRSIALKLATQEGWLRQDARLGKYELTTLGEAIVRERAGRPAPTPEFDQPTGAHPASAFAK